MLVAAGVRLTSIYGLTETGVLNKIMDVDYSPNAKPQARKPEDWAYLQFDERIKPRWVDQGDGTYELQLLVSTRSHDQCLFRRAHHVSQTCETHKLAVENLTDVPGYATNDVFKPHPIRPGLWRM